MKNMPVVLYLLHVKKKKLLYLLLFFYSYAKELVFTMFGSGAPDFGAASDGMPILLPLVTDKWCSGMCAFNTFKLNHQYHFEYLEFNC